MEKEKQNQFVVSVLVGIGFILLMLLFAIIVPCPTNWQSIVFRVVLSIGIVSYLPNIRKPRSSKLQHNTTSVSMKLGLFEFKFQHNIVTYTSLAIFFGSTFIINPVIFDNTDKCNEPFDYTMFLENTRGQSVLKGKGKIILRIENDKREEIIDNKGSVTFKQIPNRFLDRTFSLQLETDGWQFQNGKTSTDIKLQGKSVIIIVEPDNSLCCVSGSVRDEESNFISSVKVSIGDVFTLTDDNGRFSIEIPPDKQKPEQTLTAYKEKYTIWEDNVYPATKKEVKIVLIKK